MRGIVVSLLGVILIAAACDGGSVDGAHSRQKRGFADRMQDFFSNAGSEISRVAKDIWERMQEFYRWLRNRGRSPVDRDSSDNPWLGRRPPPDYDDVPFRPTPGTVPDYSETTFSENQPSTTDRSFDDDPVLSKGKPEKEDPPESQAGDNEGRNVPTTPDDITIAPATIQPTKTIDQTDFVTSTLVYSQDTEPPQTTVLPKSSSESDSSPSSTEGGVATTSFEPPASDESENDIPVFPLEPTKRKTNGPRILVVSDDKH